MNEKLQNLEDHKILIANKNVVDSPGEDVVPFKF